MQLAEVFPFRIEYFTPQRDHDRRCGNNMPGRGMFLLKSYWF